MKETDRGVPPLSEEPVEGGGELSGPCIAVPNGEYELRYIDYETARFFGSPKVVLRFAIVAPEEYAGLPVDRFYNVKKLKGPPRRFGNYVAPIRGDLYREYKKIVAEPTRTDRISFSPLKGTRIIGELEMVTSDYQHNPLPKEDQYSRIVRLVRVLPNDNW